MVSLRRLSSPMRLKNACKEWEAQLGTKSISSSHRVILRGIQFDLQSRFFCHINYNQIILAQIGTHNAATTSSHQRHRKIDRNKWEAKVGCLPYRTMVVLLWGEKNRIRGGGGNMLGAGAGHLVSVVILVTSILRVEESCRHHPPKPVTAHPHRQRLPGTKKKQKDVQTILHACSIWSLAELLPPDNKLAF
jgi:hypothetical protein